jgi:hypothetical protein
MTQIIARAACTLPGLTNLLNGLRMRLTAAMSAAEEPGTELPAPLRYDIGLSDERPGRAWPAHGGEASIDVSREMMRRSF